MKRFPFGASPPLLVFAIFTLVGVLLYFQNVRDRATSAAMMTLPGQTLSPHNSKIQDLTIHYSEIEDVQAVVLELRNQLAQAQRMADPEPLVLRQAQLAELERQRQEWQRNLQTVLAGSYAGVMTELSDQQLEIHNDYLFDNLALDPLERNLLLAALNDSELERQRLYADLRLGQLTQAEYNSALANLRSDEDIWKAALAETQFLRYQELQAARTRQSHLATAVSHASNSAGPMSDQGRELLIAAYAGLLEKQSVIDSSTSSPALVYESTLADYTDMADWLAPRLSGYDLLALETFLGYRGLELEERFLEQLRTQSPAVMP